MFARGELFHMDRHAIDYTILVNQVIVDDAIHIIYHGLPYVIGAVTLGIALYGIYEIAWIWYSNQSLLDMTLTLSCIIATGFITYFGYSMISELDTCLEKAKNERIELLARIETLENEKKTMRDIFKKFIAISEDDKME